LHPVHLISRIRYHYHVPMKFHTFHSCQ
jgi:hypothetical protein